MESSLVREESVLPREGIVMLDRSVLSEVVEVESDEGIGRGGLAKSTDGGRKVRSDVQTGYHTTSQSS